MPKTNRVLDELSKTLEETGVTPKEGRKLTRSDTNALKKMFESIPDGRTESMCDYPLSEVLLLVFMGVLSGCNRWTELEAFGTAQIRWLRKFYPYKKGIPSHDEINYIFGKIPPGRFQEAVVGFLTANIERIKRILHLKTGSKVLIHYAIDGKEENGTGRTYSSSRQESVPDQQTLHVWNVTDDICIYSEPIDRKTNEIPVAQKFLRSQKSLKGILVTFDALHTQKKTWKLILSKKGECIGGLKGNQSGLLEEVSQCFDQETLDQIKKEKNDYLKTTEKAHSQIETREYYRIDAYEDKEREKQWGRIASFLCVIKTTLPTDPSKKTGQEKRYYISTLEDVADIAEGIRSHWRCESGHWCLDVVFREDDNTTMNVNAYQNLSLMIKMALHLLKLLRVLPKYKKCSLETIRKIIGWNNEDTLKDLFMLMDRKTIAETLGNVKMTAADKKKAENLMEQEERELQNS